MAEEATASVFMSGRSQAVRIPKAFWLDAKRVAIRRRGNSLVLTPVREEDSWAAQREAIAMARADDELLFEIPEREVWEGYPRMGFDESFEHFEARVRDYERRSKAREMAWKEKHGQ